jgi:hypothetical protein
MTFTSTSALKTTGLLASSTGYNSNISDINVGTNSAVPSNSSLESFTVEWTGLFLANVTGTWTFFTNSDDGSYLWIGANATSGYTTTNATVQNGGLHAIQERSGTVVLISGVYYPIRILYGESTAGDSMIVSFTPPSGTKTTNGTGYYYNPGISYNVTSSLGSLTRSGLTSPITVSGLTANTIYTFTMTATNSGGTSVSSINYYNGSATSDYNLKFSFGTSVTPVSNTFDDTGTKTFYSLQQGRVNVLDAIRGWVFTGLNLLINSPNYTTTTSFTRSCWTYGTESNLGNVVTASASCSMKIISTSTYVATLNDSTITDPSGDRGYNTWVHQAVTYNGTTFTMYINGVSVGSTTPTAYTGTDTYLYLLSLSNSAYFKGYSDNFLSYTRALTATEIYTIYTHESTLGTTSTTVSGAPTIGTSTLVDISSASVTFTAPSGTGTITGYTVTSTPGSLTGTGTSSPIIVTGLTSLNTVYTFRVTATNSGGTSALSSASNSITTKPGPPSITTDASSIILLDASSVNVNVTAPSGTGTISSYTVTSTPGGFTGTSTSSVVSITGLTSTTTYTFTATATNTGGTSSASSASNSVTLSNTLFVPITNQEFKIPLTTAGTATFNHSSGAGYYTPFAYNTTAFTGWNTTGTSTLTTVYSASGITPFSGTVSPSIADQYLATQLGANSSSETISQDITISSTGTYTVKFYARSRSGYGASLVTVSLNGSSLVFTPITTWILYAFTTTVATTGPYTLSFVASGNQDSFMVLTQITVSK